MKLGRYEAKQTTIIYPTGCTKTFQSRWHAAKSIGVNPSKISVWVKRDKKVPDGPFKGYWFRDTKKMLLDRATHGAGTFTHPFFE